MLRVVIGIEEFLLVFLRMLNYRGELKFLEVGSKIIKFMLIIEKFFAVSQ